MQLKFSMSPSISQNSHRSRSRWNGQLKFSLAISVQEQLPSLCGTVNAQDRELGMLNFPPGCDLALRTPPWAKPCRPIPCKQAARPRVPRGPTLVSLGSLLWPAALFWARPRSCTSQLVVLEPWVVAGSTTVPPGVEKFSLVTWVPSVFAQLPHSWQRGNSDSQSTCFHLST